MLTPSGSSMSLPVQKNIKKVGTIVSNCGVVRIDAPACKEKITARYIYLFHDQCTTLIPMGQFPQGTGATWSKTFAGEATGIRQYTHFFSVVLSMGTLYSFSFITETLLPIEYIPFSK
jgi:hypothetical protein